MWVLIGVISVLYLAYKKNFGGIADTLNHWWSNISLVFRGVTALFDGLTGASFEIRGELAKEIKAAGLEGLVLTVARSFARVKALAQGFINVFVGYAHIISSVVSPVFSAINTVISWLAQAFTWLTGAIFSSVNVLDISIWEAFGTILGVVCAAVLTLKSATFLYQGVLVAWRGAMLVCTGITKVMTAAQWLFNAAMAANPMTWIIVAIIAAIVLMYVYWEDLCSLVQNVWESITGYAQNALDSILSFFDDFDLFDAGAQLLGSFIDGILSKISAVKEAVMGGLSAVRDLLPFSDAKEGPLSTLTLSGTRLMTTIGEGVDAGAGTLKNAVFGALGAVGNGISSTWDAIFGDDQKNIVSSAIPSAPLNESMEQENTPKNTSSATTNTYTIHIGSIALPNVHDARGFLEELQDSILEYTGARI